MFSVSDRNYLDSETVPFTSACGGRYRIYPVVNELSELCDMRGSFLCDIPPSPHCDGEYEEYLYELYRDIAESAPGLDITVSTDADLRLSSRLRALMRASVYGRFSLLFRGIISPKELQAALMEYSKAFCELEADGREFNGYISRGICVDTPSLLLQKPYCDGIDFCALDAERIFRLMTGGTGISDYDTVKTTVKYIFEFKKSLPRLKYSVILGERTANEIFINEFFNMEIFRFYIHGTASNPIG